MSIQILKGGLPGHGCIGNFLWGIIFKKEVIPLGSGILNGSPNLLEDINCGITAQHCDQEVRPARMWAGVLVE